MEPLEKKAKEESELEKFDALFPILVSDLADFGIKDTSILQASDWFRQVEHLAFALYKMYNATNYKTSV